MKVKTYIISSICGVIATLLVITAIVYYIDPYFQYHKPREGFAYKMEMNDFAYYNPGIAKNFEYDTIITGSSMSRAFLTSYIDEKMGCSTVKLSMAEARGSDFATILPVVTKHPELKRVIIGLDTFAYNVDKDYSSYEKPLFLYDDNTFNDVLYLTNMDGILATAKTVLNTFQGGTTTSMDEYQNYVPLNSFGREKVLDIYESSLPLEEGQEIDTGSLFRTIIENLEQNMIPFIEEHQDVEYIFYFPPYSIVKWALIADKQTEIECMKVIIDRLIGYPNVSIYFYQGETECIVDLDHYMDTIHYDSDVANKIVDYMCVTENKLTKENYEEKLEEFYSFVDTYDYDSLLNDLR